MAVVRELVTKWSFKADTNAVKRFDAAIGQTKRDVRNVGIALAGAAAAAAIFVREAGRFEQSTIAFETMLGSAEKAQKVLAELAAFAARTPFTLPGVEQSAKQLLAVGVETESLLPVLKSLGDVSAGLSVPLSRLVLNFGQVRAQGKLTGRELRDFAISGVPLLSELAKNLNKSEAEITELVSRGKIGFEETRQAFESLTTGSGRFADLMDKQSRSFFGILSNIQDSLILLSREIGTVLLPQTKDLANEFKTFLEVNKEIIKENIVALIKSLGAAMKVGFKIVKGFTLVLESLAKPLGGLGPLVVGLTKAFAAFFALRFTRNLGIIITGFTQSARAAAKFSAVIRALQLRMLLLGSSFIAAFLIIEDVVAFFQGRESFFGDLFGDLFDLENLDAEGVAKGLTQAVFRALTGVAKAIGDFVREASIFQPVIEEFVSEFSKAGLELGIALATGIGEGVSSVFSESIIPSLKSELSDLSQLFGGDAVAEVSPEQQRKADLAAQRRAALGITPLQRQITPGQAVGGPALAGGGSAGLSQNVVNNIVVNGAGGTPEANANAVRRELDNAMGQQRRDAQNALRSGNRR